MEQVEVAVEERFRQGDKVWSQRVTTQGSASGEAVDSERDDEQPYRDSLLQAAQRCAHQNG